MTSARALHTGSPGDLWDFHAEAGRPAPGLRLPPLDVERLNALEILGPPLSA